MLQRCYNNFKKTLNYTKDVKIVRTVQMRNKYYNVNCRAGACSCCDRYKSLRAIYGIYYLHFERKTVGNCNIRTRLLRYFLVITAENKAVNIVY